MNIQSKICIFFIYIHIYSYRKYNRKYPVVGYGLLADMKKLITFYSNKLI